MLGWKGGALLVVLGSKVCQYSISWKEPVEGLMIQTLPLSDNRFLERVWWGLVSRFRNNSGGTLTKEWTHIFLKSCVFEGKRKTYVNSIIEEMCKKCVLKKRLSYYTEKYCYIGRNIIFKRASRYQGRKDAWLFVTCSYTWNQSEDSETMMYVMRGQAQVYMWYTFPN